MLHRYTQELYQMIALKWNTYPGDRHLDMPIVLKIENRLISETRMKYM